MTDLPELPVQPEAAAASSEVVAAPADVLPPQPVVLPPGFELPTARQVVGRGLQLTYDSTRDIRRASLYIGLLLLGTAGPFVFVLLAAIPHFAGIDLTDLQGFTPEQQLDFLGLVAPLYVTGILASIGVIGVAIDSSLIAVGVLAGRAVGRPLTLLEATQRARQAYWRYGAAAFVVGVISFAVAFAIQLASGPIGKGVSLGEQLLASFIAAIVVLPFCYIATAIVIGDVSGMAALGRSVTLVRARLRLGLTVAAFAFAAGALQTFGLSAGLGVVGEVATVLHLQLDLTGPGLIVAIVLAAAGLIALGSLLFTVNAIAVAPQVAAFLGLTHYDAGLDRARLPVAPEPPPAAEPAPAPEPPATPVSAWNQPIVRKPAKTRWVTRPMIALIVIEALLGGLGLVSITSGRPSRVPAASSDRIIRAIDGVAGPGQVNVTGQLPWRTDPFGDQAGGNWRQGDLVGGEYAAIDVTATSVIGRVFSCYDPAVVCGPDATRAAAFGKGGWVFALAVAQDPTTLGPTDAGDWGFLVDLLAQPSAPAGDATDALAAQVIDVHGSANGWTLSRRRFANGAFETVPTAARAIWDGAVLVVIVPAREEFGQAPTAWDAFADVSGQGAGAAVLTRDWLRPDDTELLPFDPTATLTFSP